MKDCKLRDDFVAPFHHNAAPEPNLVLFSETEFVSHSSCPFTCSCVCVSVVSNNKLSNLKLYCFQMSEGVAWRSYENCLQG